MDCYTTITNMEISKFVFFLFLLLSRSYAENCPRSSCSRKQPAIHFPFRITGRQSEWCGYPGFDLSCDSNTGRTLLELPYSGKFSIQKIDYAAQHLWINDPDNCLAERVLSVNLSGSPFKGVYYQSFTFFNCSSGYLMDGSAPISCLSGSSYAIFAVPYSGVSGFLTSGCTKIKSVQAPVDWRVYEYSLSDLSADLWLKWDVPGCRKCESQEGLCGLKSNSSHTVICTNVPQRGVPRGARYAIIVGGGVPSLLLIMGLLLFLFGRIKSYADRHRSIAEFNATVAPQPTIAIVSGLDGATIDSYPKIVLGESRRLPKPDDNSCSVCLSEYQPKETLKTLPECHHCFHADCIDEWLRQNASCPLCRNSPAGTPQANVS